MTDRVELTSRGLIIRGADGAEIALLDIAMQGAGARLALTGEWPASIELDAQHLLHLEDIFGRAHRATLFPRVPRHEPDLPQVVSPMG